MLVQVFVCVSEHICVLGLVFVSLYVCCNLPKHTFMLLCQVLLMQLIGT